MSFYVHICGWLFVCVYDFLSFLSTFYFTRLSTLVTPDLPHSFIFCTVFICVDLS